MRYCFLNTMLVSSSGIPPFHPSCLYLVHRGLGDRAVYCAGYGPGRSNELHSYRSVKKPFWRRNGVVRIATRLQAGQWTVLVRMSSEARDYFPLQSVHTVLGSI
jgi:hypothetical protein